MDICNGHIAEFKQMPQIVVEVPEIITFFGTFSNLYSGKTITAAGPRCLLTAVSVSSGNQICINNLETKDRKKTSVSVFKYRKEDKWVNFIRGACLGLSEIIGRFNAFDISFSGPVSLSSDVFLCPSLAAGFVIAVNSILKLRLSNDDILGIVINTCKFCAIDVPYDIIYSIIYGRAGSYNVYDWLSGKFMTLNNPFSNSQYKMICINSNIPSDMMREEVLDTSRMVLKTVDVIKHVFNRTSVSALLYQDIIDAGNASISEEMRHCAKYLLDESQTAAQAVDAFISKDAVYIKRLLGKNGRLSREELDLTSPELDWIAKRVGDSSVVSGFGFSIISAVILNDYYNVVIEKLEDYEKIFGFKHHIYEFIPGPSARVIF